MGIEKIDLFKKQLGWTNEELSKASGIPKATIDKITAGTTTNPNLETAKALVRALGKSLDDLDDTPQPKEAPAPQDVEQEPTSHELDEWFSALPYNVKRNTMAMLSSAYEHYGQMAVMAAQDEILHKQLLREMQKQAVGNSEMEDVRIG